MAKKDFDYLQFQYIRRKDNPMVIKGGRSIGRYDLRDTFDPSVYELVYGELPEGVTFELSPRQAVNEILTLIEAASPAMRQKLYASGVITACDRLDFGVIEAVLEEYSPEGEKAEKKKDTEIKGQILDLAAQGKSQL